MYTSKHTYTVICFLNCWNTKIDEFC